jgi:hypothetical protein
MMFDPATLKKLRNLLETARRKSRRDARSTPEALPSWDRFEFVMERWARLARGEDPTLPEDPIDSQEEFFGPVSTEIDQALIDEIAPPVRAPARRRPSKRGRRPNDEWPELVLAHIYHDFTGKAPTRVWDPYMIGEVSPFFEFAELSFKAIGMRARDRALRRITTKGYWTKSRAFKKKYIRKILRLDTTA